MVGISKLAARIGAVTSAVALATSALIATATTVTAHDGEHDEPHVLVFSKTEAFRHSSIPEGITAIEELGAEHGFMVDVTEDASAFTTENLADYAAVIWLSTTGDVLNEQQQAAFESYIGNGGGYAGVHAASDTEYTWPWYGGLVGAYFSGHPAQQTATIDVADRTHPSTSHLPAEWERFDEWYNFQSNPRGDVHVLASLDETSYDAGGGGMGTDHPIAWCQYYEGGRSWYTGLGHTEESFTTDQAFRTHLSGGIQWAAGMVENDCGGTSWGNYEKVVLDNNVASPMGLDVAPDGRVIYIERAGEVNIIDPVTQVTASAGEIPVYTGQENGLLGIALDPDFATNNQVYFYYAPPDEDVGDDPFLRLSRFELTGDTLDLASEQVLLEVPHQRDTCCHSGGYLQFDSDGNLWISTGDDTSPSASDGYTPIDERDGRESYDAQRSSANTNDLRGKLLRITPTAPGDGGGYTIPEGNLFAPGTERTRPEIYAMGFRNPFRFSVDQETGEAYVADYGPDANEADPDRGSDGRVEWNIVSEPGNYGWPYCHGGAAFVDYDFATGESGESFDCASPVNDSPNNTGLTELPPVIEPEVWYGRSAAHPEIGTGGAPMGGPRYYFDETLDSERQWPASFDGSAIFYEWGQNNLYQFHLDGEQLYDITPLLPDIGVNRPHEMKFGSHDGALYVIEWGSGFGGNNPDSQIVRIDYSGGKVNPIAKVDATPETGSVPLTVEFSSEGTSHPQGGELTYAWDFGDGTTSDEKNPAHTYTEEGNYTAVLVVTDVQGRTGTANVPISVGNTEPDVTIHWPAEGTVFEYDDEIPYEVSVVDNEDGSTADGGIDCTDITIDVILGHDDHGHGMQQLHGCEGTFIAEEDAGHVDTDRITYVLEAHYTDRGSPGGTVEPTTGRDLSVMQPSRKQAEHHDLDGNIRNEETGDPLGGDRNIGWITDGMSVTYSSYNFANVDSVRFRVATPNDTSRIEVRKDAPDGELLGTADLSNTGGFQSWDWAEVDVSDPGETFDLVLVFRGEGGYLLNLNWFDVLGEGASGGAPPEIAVPSAEVSPAEPGGEAGWYVLPATLTLSPGAEDDAVDTIEYRVNGGDWAAYDDPVTFDAAGEYRVDYRAVVGEFASRIGSAEIAVDLDDPQTGVDLVGESEDGQFTGTVTVALDAADDASGVAETQWRAPGGDTTVYDGPFTVDEPGEHTIEYRSVDTAGHAEDWQAVTFASPSGAVPDVSVTSPTPGGVLPVDGVFGYDVDVVADDVDCADVTTTLQLRHADGEETVDEQVGCTGGLAASLPDEYDANDQVEYLVEAVYAPGAGEDVVHLVRGEASVTLQPQRKQAEHHDLDPDVRTEATSDELGGGLNVGWIRDGFSLAYSSVNLGGVDSMRFRVASGSDGGTLEVRKDAPDGELLGSADITGTGGWQNYTWAETPVTDPGETFTLYLVFRSPDGGFIANINFFEFVGSGVADDTAPEVTAAVSPAEPDGENGWYVTPVEVEVSASDDGTGVESASYSLDGGEWTAYSEPVTLAADGSHVLSYRATDYAGNVSETETVEIEMDGTAPSTALAGVTDGAEHGVHEVLDVSAAASDETSGVESLELALDGEPLANPSSLDLATLAAGTHELSATTGDEAGNTASEAATFTVVVSFDTASELVDRYYDEGALTMPQWMRLSVHLSVAALLAGEGLTQPAEFAVDRFAVAASDVDDEQAREALLAVADTLRAQLADGGRP